MKHLAIYYIATSNYKMGFVHFKKNLGSFYPDFRKTVIILSDGLEKYDNIVEGNITYKTYHIDHFPWPIITLFKMKYIYMIIVLIVIMFVILMVIFNII